jgi:RimJ/RimL family protein N-acetyltransferase
VPHYPKLAGAKCYLSPCSAEDAEIWAQWDNDLEVALPLGDEAYTPYPLEREKRGLEDSMKSHIFTIVDRKSSKPIGRCLLFDLDWINRKAMMGIVIGEKSHWSKGYGEEAVRLLLDYAFHLLNLNSIMLGTFSFNERGLKCFQKAGFQEIGRRRQGRVIGDRTYDIVLMDILAEEHETERIHEYLDKGQH